MPAGRHSAAAPRVALALAGSGSAALAPGKFIPVASTTATKPSGLFGRAESPAGQAAIAGKDIGGERRFSDNAR